MKGGIFGYGECMACLWRRVGVGSCLYEIDHCTALGLCQPIGLWREVFINGSFCIETRRCKLSCMLFHCFNNSSKRAGVACASCSVEPVFLCGGG